VRAIGLFTTSIDTPDNVLTMVGKAKVMDGTGYPAAEAHLHLRHRAA
jgi:hypothetical protein